METISYYYNWIVHDLGDPRVKDWTLINQPFFIGVITVFYIYLIKFVLPMWMKNRQAYNLKNILQAYNILLLVSNIGVVYGGLTSDVFHTGCKIPSFSTDPMSMRQLNFMWWTLQVKMLEFVETMFYILRNKPEQASFLHIYHHVCVVWLMWLGLKYFGGGMAGFPIIVNSTIHVIMYSYYFLTSICNSNTRRTLLKFKKTLTMLQMAQFIFLMYHITKNKYNGCPLPTILIAMYLPFVLSIFVLFLDFFKTSYTKTTTHFQKTTKML